MRADLFDAGPNPEAWAGLGAPDAGSPAAIPAAKPTDDQRHIGARDEALPPAKRSDRKGREGGEVSAARWVVETIGLLLLALVLAQGIKTFLIQPYIVPTGSMIPTIQINDRVLANKLVYWVGGVPEQGDIVVLDDPTGQFDMLVKRVIAVGGQTVDLADGKVFVDGEQLIEPYTHGLPTEPQVQTFPYRVPEGEVWVMGDNRTNSGDSRSFGSVPIDTVRGRGFWTYWPADRFGALR